MDLLAAAVRNNVAWCDVVSRGELDESVGIWTTVESPPPLFPDLVTVRPGVAAGRVAERLADRPACSVKDSFADVDLAPYGFELLFTAQWIAMPSTSGTADDWVQIGDEAGLSSWCEAAGIPALPVTVLHDPTVRVQARSHDGSVTGGAIVNGSDGVAGLSNVFGDDIRSDVAAVAAPLPVVGYEHGADLDAALAAGFVELGPLRVWLRG